MTTDEVTAAFAHPEVRAAATAVPTPPDRISLRDHVREAEVGAFGAERGLSQRLRFAVVVEVAARPRDDDVDAVLSYDRVVDAIDAALAAGRADLLETLAERVAAGVLREPQATRAFVRIEKLDRGPGALGVEIVRDRTATPPPSPSPRPRVVYLGLAALADAGLPAALDLLVRGPLVLCVGASGLPLPRAFAPSHARRVALLAVDQAAWAFASRHPRLHVASTRTEIDWALRRGHPCVWAPSRIAPDEADAPRDLPLAAWLAERLDATELRVIGADAPAGIGRPVAHGTVAEPLG